jgi:heme oxygenase
MRLIDQIGIETEAWHADADEHALTLCHLATAPEYQRYLARMYGFVAPLERALVATPHLERCLDLRRFRKHQLLRRDLESFHTTSEMIERLPRCEVPAFGAPEVALGWAYVVERSALGHTNLFRHLAVTIPGDVAFTSAYLKCYFGSLGESWKAFGDALDAAATTPASAERMIEAARTAFGVYRSWRGVEHDPHATLMRPAARAHNEP